MDASSHYQDSLPLSSDELIERLNDWGIAYKLFEHVPLRTVEDAKKVQDMFLQVDEGGAHIKNLYLRDRKKKNLLLVAEQDQPIDLKALSKTLGYTNLSFGSADRLMEHLGVRPGAVTPLAMITGVEKNVALFMDEALREASFIYVHPLVNDRSLELPFAELEKFLQKIDVTVNWVAL